MAVPRRQDGHRRWTLRVEPPGDLLYDRRSHAYVRCSRAETFLITAAVTLPLTRARRLLAGEIGADRAAAAVAAVRAKGLFRRGQFFRGRVVELPGVRGAYAAPLVVHLGVTAACNFSCAHCYARAGRRAPGELTLTEVRRLLDEMQAIGCCKLVLGGGEPFLRRDLPAIVRAASDRGIDCFVHTNGALLRRSLLQRLAQAPPAGLAVSLDGPDARVNDAIRGAGAFAAAQRALALLRRHYPPGFNINFTVTSGNGPLVGRMVDLAAAAGAGVLLLRPAYPAGAALDRGGTTCDRATFVGAVAAARARGRQLGVTVDATHPDERGVPDFEGFGCVAGRVVLGITPTGDVTPCLNLPESYVAGNLRASALTEIWRGGASFCQLRRLRPPAACGNCEHYASCRGGCRVRALVEHGDVGDRDAWCTRMKLPT